jgi:ribosome-associated protein
VLIRKSHRVKLPDFGAHKMLPYFGCARLEMKLHAGLDEMENVGNSRFLLQLSRSRMHEVTIIGLHFSGDRLPDTAPVGGALEKKDLDLGRSAVNNDLNFSYDALGHGCNALYTVRICEWRMSHMIEVGDELRIPAEELKFRVGTSSGPGGQNVNRVRTRVTVCFDVAHSACLSDIQRERILERLAARINKEGVLKVRSQKHRTQGMNRVAAEERLVELLAAALHVSRPRKKTRTTWAAKERRLEEKKRRSHQKRGRTRPGSGLDQD